MGSNVTSWPMKSTAVHCFSLGQATPNSAWPKPPVVSTGNGVGVPGDCGLNVTSSPAKSTAVHWVPEGHATPDSAWL